MSLEQTVQSVRKFMEAGNQVEHLLTSRGQTFDQAALYNTLIQEEFDEFNEAPRNSLDELDAICDLIYVLVGYSISLGYDLSGAMEEVCRSNLSKVNTITGRLEVRADGKILKPPTYSPPELGKFVPSSSHQVPLDGNKGSAL